MARRGGWRPRRYVLREQVRVWVPSDRWGPRRANVDRSNDGTGPHVPASRRCHRPPQVRQGSLGQHHLQPGQRSPSPSRLLAVASTGRPCRPCRPPLPGTQDYHRADDRHRPAPGTRLTPAQHKAPSPACGGNHLRADLGCLSRAAGRGL